MNQGGNADTPPRLRRQCLGASATMLMHKRDNAETPA
jgi:hypothetical protein